MNDISKIKGRRILVSTLVLVLLLILSVGLAFAQKPGPGEEHTPQTPLGTGFTYQGQLKTADGPVSDDCLMAFRLYDDPGAGSQVGSAITATVPISAGLFTVNLDFGSTAFTGDARWMGIKVKCTGDTSFADLGRLELTATPYALYALGAPWSGLTGVPAGFGDGVDDVSAVVSGTSIFAGDGLTQVSGGDSVTIAVDFAGSGGDYGTAITVPRSDHVHDGRYYTQGQLNTSGGGGQVHWDNLAAVPADLADGDDDTTYAPGTGLTLDDATFSVVTATIQSRVSTNCPPGFSIRTINQDGTVVCEEDDIGTGGGDGDITAVYAGTGLTGGGETGAVTLAVGFAGTGVADTAARSDHDHDATYTLLGHPHAGEDITSGTVADARIAATVARDSEITPTVWTHDGAGSDLDADLLDGQHASAFAADGHDHWGESWTGSGTGLWLSGGSTGLSGAGTSTGILGSASATNGRGVHGYVDTTSGENYGVYGRSASTGGRGVYGYANAASGTTTGVYGVADSPDGRGVYGYASATSGVSYGVRGESESSIGRGVAGYGLFGVFGESDSNIGSGVFGSATSASGTTYGVQGNSDSTSGRGVYGYTSATSGGTRGVYGRSDSTSGRGVYGYATATSGTTYGVYGESDSTSGRGIYGSASATSGTTYGVYGESHSPDGYGVRGYNDASSGNAAGVYGSAPVSPNGRGVYGISRYGVYGETWNSDGYALYGEAMTSSGTNYGVYGESNSSNGYGGYFVNSRSNGTALYATGTSYGVYGESDSPDGYGGYFVNSDTDGTALYATGDGSGRGKATLRVDNTEETGGVTAYMTNDSNYATAHFSNSGSGEVLYLQNGGTDAGGTGGGDFIRAVNEPEGDTQFRVSTSGYVYADGGYRCGQNISDVLLVPGLNSLGQNETSLEPCLQDSTPADFAEMFPAAGSLEPGDVLAIGPDGDLTQSSEPYQTTVVGVYSFRPSFLGNAQFADEDGYVPLALLGIVPVKASAENGSIQPGDLLVASSTPGHAMKAGENPPQGTVIGKALEPLTEGIGFIRMVVTLQ
jgi:hypothetical protein